MKPSTNNDSMIHFNPGSALGLRLKRWFALLLLALGVGSMVNAQTNLVPILNGDFTSDHLTSLNGVGWSRLGGPSATSGWNASSSDMALNNGRLLRWSAFLSQYSPSYNLNYNLGGPAIIAVSFKAGYADQAGRTNTATLKVGGTTITNIFTIGQTIGTYMAVFTNTTATGNMVLSFTGGGTFMTDVSGVGFFSPTDPPIITQQPVSSNPIPTNVLTTLTVTAIGIPPIAYQWQSNGVPILGATNAILTGVSFGNYEAVATAGNSLSVTSTVAQVIWADRLPILNGDFTSDHYVSPNGLGWSELNPPAVTSYATYGWNGSSAGLSLNWDRFQRWSAFLSAYSPSYNLNYNLGGPAIIAVSFRAGYFDQAGRTNTATLTVGGTTITNIFTVGQALDTYMAVFTNTTATGNMVLSFTGGGTFMTDVSGVGFFSPTDPPIITQQPVSSNPIPTNVLTTLTVTAIGIPPIAYQWQSNGVPILDATNAVLTGVSLGNYEVVATAGNSLSVTSTVAQVIWANRLPILNGNFSTNHYVSPNGPNWSGLDAPGVTSYATYGWNISGNSGLSLNHDRFGVWAAYLPYYFPTYDLNLNLAGPAIMVVSFKAGYADQSGKSVTATLSVGGTPISQSFTIGQTLDTYMAVFDNNGGATGDMVLSFGGNQIFVTAVSDIYFFSPTDPPVITQQPSGSTVHSPGGNLNLSVGAIGIPQLTYQWQTNGVNLSDQTNVTLNITNVTSANSGNYTVVVSNSGGSVTSSVAQVTVMTPPPITTLSILPQGGNLTLSWPIATVGWILETTTNLTSPSWTAVPGVTNNSVTVTRGGGNAFFRLHY